MSLKLKITTFDNEHTCSQGHHGKICLDNQSVADLIRFLDNNIDVNKKGKLGERYIIIHNDKEYKTRNFANKKKFEKLKSFTSENLQKYPCIDCLKNTTGSTSISQICTINLRKKNKKKKKKEIVMEI